MLDHDTELIAEQLSQALQLLYILPPPPLPQHLATLMARLADKTARSQDHHI